MIEIPAFCDEWYRYERLGADEQERYVASEIRRLDREGLPILTTVLAALDGMVQQIALDLVMKGHDANGEQLFEPRQWMLRLRQGAQPPVLDPHGRELPLEERGKVLAAKVGNIGAHVNLAKMAGGVDGASNRFSGDARPGMREKYHVQKIGRTATPVTFDRAVAVLRQWGVGVRRNQHAVKSGWRPGSDYGEGQDRWLVEEVPPGREDPKKKASAAA